MEVIPAIDLRAGRCVRLYRGDYRLETVYSDDPLAVALAWQEQGATRLHLVDLDGAAEGGVTQLDPDLPPSSGKGLPLPNLDVILRILQQLSIPVQVGGGIRHEVTAQLLLEVGVGRVVIGTAAVQQPSLVQSLCQDYGSERVVVALDARHGQVSIKGWTETTSMDVLDMAQQMAMLGVCRLLYTDIPRDGTLSGPDYATNAALVENTGLAILASGGIASLEHLRRLTSTGVEGAILGRALYTGAIKLPQAITAAKPL